MEKKNYVDLLNKEIIDDDDYHNNPKRREMRCLNSPSSIRVQNYLRLIGLLPTAK